MNRVVADWQLDEIARGHAQGMPVADIAELHGVSRRTVYRYLQVRKRYCAEDGCPVLTPRPRCYFHAVSA